MAQAEYIPYGPYGSPPQGYTGPKRSLVLAGGGMRLSYQAGAIRALFETGLCFAHVDGTSGGAINLAMLFSGLSPIEMCDLWRTLNPADFVSMIPMKDYLNVPDLIAMGDADGVVNKVFPHLGIDIEKIRAVQGMEGTFNVCNYTRKTNEVILHQQIDVDYLVAGMSLPMFLPPVAKGDYLYVDSAFIRDANLKEAVRRGADELWVVWVLGNTNQYKGGFLNQYVQMLEMSANGALHDDFEWISEINTRIEQGETVYGRTTPIKLHLIKPEYPLPLDPDLLTARIDNATLIDMGYADAKNYLRCMSEDGLPFEPETTKMKEYQGGLAFRETLTGAFALGETDPQAGEEKGKASGTALSMQAAVRLHDVDRFIADPDHTGSITGHISFAPLGNNLPAKSGVFNLFSPDGDHKHKIISYGLAFEHEGQDYYLAGQKNIYDDPGFDLWQDTTTLYSRLHTGADETGPVIGAGILRLSSAELTKLIATMHVINGDPSNESNALVNFGRLFLGGLWETYLKMRGRD